jgi:hypothetical protein
MIKLKKKIIYRGKGIIVGVEEKNFLCKTHKKNYALKKNQNLNFDNV